MSSRSPLPPHEDGIDRDRLQTALNQLPEVFRVAVVMYYFEECAYREIAEQLGVPIGTVMSRLARAKDRLRSMLCEPSRKGGSGERTSPSEDSAMRDEIDVYLATPSTTCRCPKGLPGRAAGPLGRADAGREAISGSPTIATSVRPGRPQAGLAYRRRGVAGRRRPVGRAAGLVLAVWWRASRGPSFRADSYSMKRSNPSTLGPKMPGGWVSKQSAPDEYPLSRMVRQVGRDALAARRGFLGAAAWSTTCRGGPGPVPHCTW